MAKYSTVIVSRFCRQNILILLAEYPYSAGRISIFCRQNLNILPAEFGYSADRIETTKNSSNGPKKLVLHGLNLAQLSPLLFFFVFF